MGIKVDKMSYDQIVAKMLVINLYLLISKIILNASVRFVFRNIAMINVLIILILFMQLFYLVLGCNLHIRINIWSIIVLLICILMWGYSYLAHPEYFISGHVGGYFQDFCIYSLFVIIFLPTMKDLNYICYYFEKYIYILTAVALYSFFVFTRNGHELGTGLSSSMTYGYNTSIIGIVMMNKYLAERKKIDLVLACLLFTAISLIGSRFSLLILGVFFVVIITKYCYEKKKYGGIIMLYVFVAFMLINVRRLLEIAYQLIQRINLPGGRAIERMLSEGLINDNGRSQIHNLVMTYVKKRMFFGYGAGGVGIDRRIVQPHGFLFDFLMTFGLVFGTLLISTYFILLIHAYRKVNSRIRDLFLVFLCTFVPTMTIQRCLWDQYQFWWCLAIIINVLSERNKKLLYSKEKKCIKET